MMLAKIAKMIRIATLKPSPKPISPADLMDAMLDGFQVSGRLLNGCALLLLSYSFHHTEKQFLVLQMSHAFAGCSVPIQVS